MKKILLFLIIFLLSGCNDANIIENPNGKSLTYKYFNEKKYNGTNYNIKLKTEKSVIVINKAKNDVFYKITGSMDLIILEKNSIRYNFDTNNKTYSAKAIMKQENYTYGILPVDMKTLKNQKYKTGKKRLNGHKYIFETYKYDDVEITYYFDNKELIFINKKTNTEDLLYKLLEFDTSVEKVEYKIPDDYVEITY